MPKRKTQSECKSETCGAADPRVVDCPLSYFPEEVQQKLKELGLDREKIRRCTYCGDIWVEKMEFQGSGFWTRVIMVGIDNHVGRGGMIWRILE